MADGKRRHDVLLPVVATLTSAVAGYVAKKGPQYLEQTLLPKLRETKQPAGTGDETADESNDDLERRRRERAEHRAARRQAS